MTGKNQYNDWQLLKVQTFEPKNNCKHLGTANYAVFYNSNRGSGKAESGIPYYTNTEASNCSIPDTATS